MQKHTGLRSYLSQGQPVVFEDNYLIEKWVPLPSIGFGGPPVLKSYL
jgi:hypothetical protein